MLFRLVRPVRRSGSTIPYFVQRIPAEIRRKAVGRILDVPCGGGFVRIAITAHTQTIRFSLRSRDPAEVKIRQASAAAYLERVWNGIRRGEEAPTVLTHRQAVALSKELYQAWTDESRVTTDAAWVSFDGGGKPCVVPPEEEAAGFEAARSLLDRIKAGGGLESVLGSLVNRLLLAKGIGSVTDQSRLYLLEEFHRALGDAFEARARNYRGDYSPDRNAERFPEWTEPKQSHADYPRASTKVSLKALLEDWWQEAKAAGRKPATYNNYRNTMGLLIKFLAHDDATRVTPDDILRFKDHRLATINPRTKKTISARTVMDGDLGGLKTVFEWAVVNRRRPSNPAKGITIKVGKKPKLRSKGFTDEEAEAILRAASGLPASNRDMPQTLAAKRWVPWLCAYTGARVGEIAQLRKEDVRQESGHWVIHISPEAGTVKTNEARTVPLHACLVEQGFADFVKLAPSGHLFLRRGSDGDVLGPLRGVKNRLAEFAREIVPDKNVAPNHGWRHRFKTVGMEAGIDPRVLDAIQGQRPRTVAETYGDVTLKTMAAAIGKLARIAFVISG